MAVSNSLWVLVLMTAMTPCVVYTAPTGVLEEPVIKEEVIGPDTKITEAMEEVKHLDDLDEDIEKALVKEESLEKIYSVPTPDDKPEAPKEEKEIVQDEVDEVINDNVEEDTDDVVDGDVIDEEAPLGSSESDLLDYLMLEPSMDYYSLEESALSPWLYDLPNEPSNNEGLEESKMWSSNFDIFDEYLESYYGSSAVEDVVDNGIDLDTPGGAFDGIPVEEMNNQVDQTVDEFLCQLGLCDNGNVQYLDEEQLEPNEVQFTEEGMMGNEKDEVQDEKDIYTIENKPDDQTKEDTNTSVSEDKGENIQSRSKREVSSMSQAGTRHRSKRDLSWNEPEQGQSDLIEKINALERQQAQDEKATQIDQVLTPEERFEDLIKYFKNEADENTGSEGEEFYIGTPGQVYNEVAAEAGADETEEVGEEEVGENEIEEGEFLDEDDEMEDDDADEDIDEEGWGAFLVPGSPYREGSLTYDGYKRDDEKESLKVYVESLPNLEGYRKRSDQPEYLNIDPRSTDFRRQIDPRSPPDEIRYPKTGLEPFSREKYFPVFSASDAMADEAILDPDWTVGVERNDAIIKYNELLDLLNTELEAAVLISSIEDMAAELGRNQLLLDELEREEAEDELQLALDENNQDILGFLNAGNSRQVKRTPRVIDYQDFNEYPPVFQRSFSPTGRGLESLSDDELLSLYNEYLQEAEEEDNWGDFVYQPRTRRDGEDILPGPHVGYYVQGRMIGDLMKPKRIEEDGYQNPYILLQPSDLGYEQWPGDFDVYYDTRDGSFIMDPEPNDAMPVSEEALLDALEFSRKNVVVAGEEGKEEEEEEEGEEEEDGRWGDFQDNIDDFQDDLEEIDFDIGQLEELRRLTEFAEALNEEDEKIEEEEFLRALLFN